MSIQLNKPFKPNFLKLTKYIESVNDSSWYTNFGPLHQQLTSRLEEYLGVKNLLLVSNGTVALQVAYKTLNTKNVLTTPFSFVATASSLLWQGIDISFSDIDSKSYNLCPESVESVLNQKTNIDTIVATHVYGNPCNVQAFARIASDYNVKVIYDAAHAFGVNVEHESILNFGDASTLSFHATKVFHTVEGGAIVFKTRDDYENAKKLINFGIQNDGTLGAPGINGKLNEYQCAVGLTILDNIEEILHHRSTLFSIYRNGLSGVVTMPEWHLLATLNGAYMPIYVGNELKRDKLINSLENWGIQYRRYFYPSLDSVFKDQKNYGSANSNRIAESIICLPLHFYMTSDDVKFIIKRIKEVML
ncbi:DegT/DnrJ/EryC1/StrS aminotransferase family protein [Shewanella algae]|uniref:DegT/DnrJ/EryC1/StrS aminotransferase family protein n=1 Tax=Shewanella algae TaxID=38313 RepID=UPI00271F0B8E|nr:DegT/DnrJ/EryC1/StrS family aminotransferase [Shewanella algae]MDO8254155.1 DegT/DnrJ/EryC1/StrS family aminotransferase [Shewanella algae]